METEDARLNDAIREMRSAASIAVEGVEDVASVLYEVGMGKLARRLINAIGGLNECSKRLSQAYGDQLSQDLRHNETMTANLFLLALKAAGEKAA